MDEADRAMRAEEWPGDLGGGECYIWGDTMNKVRSIELFSGAGGLALGLDFAGCHHVALVERDHDACETVRLNQSLNMHPVNTWRLLEEDVRHINYNELGSDIQLVAGGPPCQPFSLGGKHRAFNDSRDMFPEAVRAVRETSPSVFIFENVKGLVRKAFSTYFGYIQLQLSYPLIVKRENEDWTDHLARLEKHHTSNRSRDLSYRVIPRLLNAANYGVPQHRHRVFIVGFRSDLGLKWSFPKETHDFDALLWAKWVSGKYWDEHKVPVSKREPIPRKYHRRVEVLKADFANSQPPLKRWRTVRDAISDLPAPVMAGQPCRVHNHIVRLGAKAYAGHTGSVYDEPSKTLKAGAHGVPGGENMVALPSGELRYFTVRESARLQTFPDNYVFATSWTESMRQIGNAVPVQLARTVAESVLSQLQKSS